MSLVISARKCIRPLIPKVPPSKLAKCLSYPALTTVALFGDESNVTLNEQWLQDSKIWLLNRAKKVVNVFCLSYFLLQAVSMEVAK